MSVALTAVAAMLEKEHTDPALEVEIALVEAELTEFGARFGLTLIELEHALDELFPEDR